MKKASSIVEIGLVLGLVVLVTVGVMTVSAKLKTNVAGWSQTHDNPKHSTSN